MAKRALITGSNGQDGSYLKELLEEKGYEVTGITKEGSDLQDKAFVEALVKNHYGEFYNFASVATVESPWDDPVGVVGSTGLIPLTVLEAIRAHSPQTRFFQASSAEMFGDPLESPQGETTPFNPQSPYGWGKLLAHEAVGAYRAKHGVYAVSGILFNHESPRRGIKFVTRKITSALAGIKNGSSEALELGNLDARRDWSFAGDIVRGAWMSLQQGKADDYVFASGEVHTVREFVEAAANILGMRIAWQGSGADEKGYDEKGNCIVTVNPKFFRPVEANIRRGNFSKAKKELGWEPKTSFQELVKLLIEAELQV